MRGKPKRGLELGAQAGLIPAHAGKTTFDASRCSRIRAHPRSRGENGAVNCSHLGSGGSSPLTRGKLLPLADIRFAHGLIPAHARKTSKSRWSPTPRRAHPHSCEENERRIRRDHLRRGSSPLMRGKHFLTYAFFAQIRQTLESPELCVSSESYSPRAPAPPATSRNARAASRERSTSPHSHQPTRWSTRSPRGQTPPSE